MTTIPSIHLLMYQRHGQTDRRTDDYVHRAVITATSRKRVCGGEGRREGREGMGGEGGDARKILRRGREVTKHGAGCSCVAACLPSLSLIGGRITSSHFLQLAP